MTAARIVMQRAIRGWDSLEDCLQRSGIDKDQRRVLAKIGAFDTLTEHRRDALWKVETYLDQDDLFSWGKRRETGVALVSESGSSATYQVRQDRQVVPEASPLSL